MIIPLLGKIKEESNDATHLIPCVAVTSSGVNVKRVLRKLINLKTSVVLRDGSAISGETGKLLEPSKLDELMVELLVECYNETRRLFPLDIDTEEKIRNTYQCFRTFRRTSDTRAIERKVSESNIEIVNCWSQ